MSNKGVGIPSHYKKDASHKVDVLWKVSIFGRKTLTNDIPLHMSLRVFDYLKPEQIKLVKEKVQEHKISTPNPRKLKFNATTHYSPHTDHTYYMLKISGVDSSYEKFFNEFKKGFGFSHQEFMPHITIDKSLYDKIKKNGLKPSDIKFEALSIEEGARNPIHEFDHQEFEKSEKMKNKETIDEAKGEKDINEKSLEEIQKDTAKTWASRALAAYKKYEQTMDPKWKIDAEEYRHEAVEHASLVSDVYPELLDLINKTLEKYRKSSFKQIEEFSKPEELEKSLKHVAAGIATVAGLAGSPTHSQPAVPKSNISSVAQHKAPQSKPVQAKAPKDNGYSSKRMLNTIAAVESQKGKYTNHKEIKNGLSAGSSAYGKYGLTEPTIRDTISMHPELKQKHGKATKLKGNDLKNYLHDNPGLEDAIAEKHLSRLEHHFGRNPASIGHAWISGISGTNKALKQGQDINKHWHVMKINDAYSKEK